MIKQSSFGQHGPTSLPIHYQRWRGLYFLKLAVSDLWHAEGCYRIMAIIRFVYEFQRFLKANICWILLGYCFVYLIQETYNIIAVGDFLETFLLDTKYPRNIRHPTYGFWRLPGDFFFLGYFPEISQKLGVVSQKVLF